MKPFSEVLVVGMQDAHRYEFADPTKIKNLVKNYSQFISFPIYTWQEKTQSKKVPYFLYCLEPKYAWLLGLDLFVICNVILSLRYRIISVFVRVQVLLGAEAAWWEFPG